MKELRITPQQAIEAYDVSGLNVAVEEYVCGNRPNLCGCPLGALYFASHPVRSTRTNKLYQDICAWADKTYGIDYVLGFTAGFDHPGEPTCYSEGRALLGHQDGVAVALAVAEAFPQTN